MLRSSTLLGVPALVIAFALIAIGDEEQESVYNPSSVVDLTGVVEGIRDVQTPASVCGIHFMIRTERGEEIDAYIGPATFVKDFVTTFRGNSPIRVVGSKVRSGRMTVLLARELHKGETTLYLRDKEGKPHWVK